jgi:hypothetical protein
MTTSVSIPAKPAVAKRPRGAGKARTAARRKPTKGVAAKNAVIAADLAPAVAIALLDKTERARDEPPPALDCLAAGVSASETQGNVRLQLLFENGAVLPVEMSTEAGAALANSLSAAPPTPEHPKPKRSKSGAKVSKT